MMEQFLIDLAFSTVIVLLRQMAAAGALKPKYRAVFLKVFTLIWGVFQTDESFRAVVGAEPLNDPSVTEASL